MLISSFRAEDRIINQGDEGNSMYVILSGKVHIHDGDFVGPACTKAVFR